MNGDWRAENMRRTRPRSRMPDSGWASRVRVFQVRRAFVLVKHTHAYITQLYYFLHGHGIWYV